ncbi:hypothetical protein V5O48_003671 [Marasmius crinis-equi]|uniref:Uncharacterized protein n=1 Tax=Marasmius crinis-equi TaxID=585013 RepID=A0ABR3FT16_9AGAR
MLGRCKQLGTIVAFSCSTTCSASLVPKSDWGALTPDTPIRRPKFAYLSNDDKFSAMDWIIWRDQANIFRVGHVIEIVQVVGSRSDSFGQADWVLVQEGKITGVHNEYGLPNITLNAGYTAIETASSILCRVNVQHDCARMNCSIQNARPVVEERELSSRRKDVVVHIGGPHFVLNTGQMRDAAILDYFRVTPAPLSRKYVLDEAVGKVFDARKAKASPTISPVVQTDGTDPAQMPSTSSEKSSRSTGRNGHGSGRGVRGGRGSRGARNTSRGQGRGRGRGHGGHSSMQPNAPLSTDQQSSAVLAPLVSESHYQTPTASKPRPRPRPRPVHPGSVLQTRDTLIPSSTCDNFQTHVPNYGEYARFA